MQDNIVIFNSKTNIR